MPLANHIAMTAPAYFVGVQAGFGNLPAIELYTLSAPVGDHPAGSTVSGATLEKHGFTVIRGSLRKKRPKEKVQSSWGSAPVTISLPGMSISAA